ncbi:hypothetical protein [Hydrogenimonas sp. SS33]|uniref:hypothetical protein n=1 Tax=Hydrogenimonas leucolamina TaxID=2954236 RepID=UPI00336C0B8D
MKKEEINFAQEQFKRTMIPGKVQRFLRHCVLTQLISLIHYSIRALGIILLNLRNEKEIPQ